MSKNKKIITLIIVATAILAIGLVKFSTIEKKQSPTSKVITLPGYLPPNSKREDFYIIQVEEKDGEKIVSNMEEGISLRMPLNWEVFSYLAKVDQPPIILGVAYSYRKEGDEVESSRVDLTIAKKENPLNLSLEEWFNERLRQFLNTEYYYKTHPSEYQDSKIYLNSNPAYELIKKNYSTQLYYLKAKKTATIYEVKCDVEVDEPSIKYVDYCLNILQTSLKLF